MAAVMPEAAVPQAAPAVEEAAVDEVVESRPSFFIALNRRLEVMGREASDYSREA